MTYQRCKSSHRRFVKITLLQRRQIPQNLLVIFQPIYDAAATLQIRQNLVVIFRCSFVVDSSKLRRSNVADSTKFIGHFRPICDVAATLQIRQSLLVIFCRSFVVDSSKWVVAASQIWRNFLVIFRRKFVVDFSKLRHSNVADSRRFIGHFQPICKVQRRRRSFFVAVSS